MCCVLKFYRNVAQNVYRVYITFLFRYSNPLMKYVTKFQPKYPFTYAPFSTGIYAQSCSEGSFKAKISDCSTYYVCVNAEFVRFSCPSGLHWNNVLQICDWPLNAKCNLSPPDGIGEVSNQVESTSDNFEDGDISIVGPVVEVTSQIPATIQTTPATIIPPATISVPINTQDTGMKVVCCK